MYGRIGGSVLRKPLPAWSEVGRRRRARRHTPCVPIRPLSDGESFMRKVKRFLSSDIMHFASNPQEYSDFVRRKAERAATVGGGYSSTYDDPDKPARFFSYQVG